MRPNWPDSDLIRTTTMFVARFVIDRSRVRIPSLAVLVFRDLQWISSIERNSNLRLSYDFLVPFLSWFCDAEERGTTYPVPNHSDERAKLPEVRESRSRGNSLFAKAGVSARR